ARNPAGQVAEEDLWRSGSRQDVSLFRREVPNLAEGIGIGGATAQDPDIQLCGRGGSFHQRTYHLPTAIPSAVCRAETIRPRLHRRRAPTVSEGMACLRSVRRLPCPA